MTDGRGLVPYVERKYIGGVVSAPRTEDNHRQLSIDMPDCGTSIPRTGRAMPGVSLRRPG